MKRRGPEYGVPAAVAAAAGSLVAGAFCCGAVPWYAVPVAAVAAFLLITRPGALLVSAGAAAVLLSALAREALSPRPGLGPRPVGAHMKLRIEDPRISRLPELASGVRTAAATLLEFTIPGGNAPATKSGARVFVQFPGDFVPPVFGTLLDAEGVLTPVDALRDPGGGFDFPAFLKRRDFAACARLRHARAVGRVPGLRGRLLDLRDRMLATLFDGVDSPTVRQLAAALYCGIGSGMPGDLRRKFAAAGIVHIFSVSGMHVAVLAMFLGVLLRALPFRSRWLLLAAAVWLYVLATGAGTPAIRAGVMVTLWCLLRTALFRLSGFDILCWTATLLLVADPKLAASAGAQYSFVITGALLLLAERRNRTKFPRRTPDDFAPSCFRSAGSLRAARFRDWSMLLLSGAVTAFLAGAGISLAASAHRLIPGSIAANILISLLMPWYFALFFVQFSFGFCGAGGVTSPLFVAAFEALRRIADTTARLCSPLGAAPPHWSLVALYTLALFVFLRVRDRRIRCAAASVAGVLMFCRLAAPSCLPPTVMVRSGSYASLPLVAVAEPAAGIAVVVNLPDRDGALEAAELLRLRGIRGVETVGVSEAPGGLRALAALIREMPVKRVRLPETDARRFSRSAVRLLPEGAAHFESERLHHDLFKVSALPQGFRLDYSDPGSKLCFVMKVLDRDRGREVVLESPDAAPLAAATLPWSIDPGVWKYEFE